MTRAARLRLVAVPLVGRSARLRRGRSGHSATCRSGTLDVEAAMDAIGLQPGMVVGEAGAGDGYFTLPMAKRVGKAGAVYANDISRRALSSLEARARDDGLANVRTVVGEVDDPLFPGRTST